MIRNASAVVLALTCISVNGLGPEMVNRHHAQSQQAPSISVDIKSQDSFVAYCKECRGRYPDAETQERCTKALEKHARYQKAVLDCLITAFKAAVVILEKTRDSL